MRFIGEFLSPTQASCWLKQLEQADWIDWQRETFSIFGRKVQAPRTLAWFGEPGLNYRYSAIDHHAWGWPEPLQALKRDVEKRAQQPFNFLLLNRYVDGSEYMGWHRDDERGCCGSIASLSLGTPRRFSIDEQTGDELAQRKNFELGDGSLLIFDGRQRHCLRASKKLLGPRINLTFRQISL